MKNLIKLFVGLSIITSAHAGDVSKGKFVYSNTCVGCHGATGEGVVGPKLAGQSTKEISEKLKAYKAGEQRGPMTSMMAPIAQDLSDEDIENIAAYIPTLK